MRTIGGISLVVAGLLLALTALLVRGTAPDAALHQRTMAALHELVLQDAALQRDVLKARTGLLPDYDSLVRATASLHAATAELQDAPRIATGEAAAAIAQRQAALADAVAAQEKAVEAFKSENALLQNSLRYVGHLTEQLAAVLPSVPNSSAPDVTAFAGTMLRLDTDASSENVAALKAAVDRVAARAPGSPLQADLEALVRHGRLIAAKASYLDVTVAQMLESPIAVRAGELQADYLTQHGRAESRATWSQRLLYAAAVGLLGWLAWLVLRLRASTWRLESRLRFEAVVAGIAASFIDLPRERLQEGMTTALGALAGQLGADRVEARFGASPSFKWPIAPSPHPAPEGRSRLRIPLRHGNVDVGWLDFEAARRHRRWTAQDRALLQAASEILAGVMERERAAVEREVLEAKLHQAERMEAVGRLAGGIAHDFNNILGAILGYAEMAAESLPKGSRCGEHVRQVQIAGERARCVVDRILAFSRSDDPELRPLRLYALCVEAVGLLRGSLPASVSIILNASPQAECAAVFGDASRLQLVVLNLATNAAQAMDGRGELTLCLGTVETETASCLSHGVLPAGRYVQLAVTDTGQGIDPATAPRIFEPFFTTKEAGRGTGLGLATSWSIVADHGGTIHLRSRPGQGSTFEVWLPRTEAHLVGKEGEFSGPVPEGRGQTVLLVDDEQPLVLLGEEVLASLGYEPVGFSSAPKALAAFEADPARFDLALTDEVMPDMTGTHLAAALHRLRPALPVVLMTGFGGPVGAERLREAGIAEALRKPLARRTIAEALARHIKR